MNLGAHLLMDGFLNRYDAAIVITGDSDLVTLIQMACQELKMPADRLNPQRLSGPGGFHNPHEGDDLGFDKLIEVARASRPILLL